MKEIPITGKSISTMCRLCLSSDSKMVDIFKFSTSMENKIVDVIMKCAPVQITERDEMPNIICQLCYTQLEKIHQFQVQAVLSEKTLRRYIRELHTSNKETRNDSSIQRPSDDPLIQNSKADVTVKSESLEHDEVFDTDVNWKEKEFVSCNSEQIIKEESGCDNSLNPTEYAFETVETLFNDNDSEISCEDRKINNGGTEAPANFSSVNKNNWEFSVKSKIKDKSTNDNSRLLTKYNDDTINSTIAGDCREISRENPKIDISHTPSFCFADVIEYFDKREVGNKNVLENNQKYKKVNKMEMYQCDICETSFSRLEDFEGHKRVHTSDRPYQCDVCNKFFSEFCKLNIHKLTHIGEKPYKCDVCNKCFSKLCILKYHERTHTGEKPYRCDICDKGFSRSDSLNIHKRIHTGEKQYKCNICNKGFSKLCSLKSHNWIHTGEKPYKCDICNKCFPRPEALNTHKRAHTGIKPYKCDVCSRCFMHLWNLKSHERTHTGLKPFQCNVCSKCFTRSSDLRKHNRVHTGEKPYQCDVCKNSFRQYYDLKTHKRTHSSC